MKIIKYISSKIGIQLFISFSIIAGITALSFFTTIGSLKQIRDTQKNISDITVPFLTKAQQLSTEVSSYILMLEQLTNFDTQLDFLKFKKQITQKENSFSSHVRKLERKTSDDNEGIVKLKSILQQISLNTKKLEQERLVSYKNALAKEKHFINQTLKTLRKSLLILRRLSITTTTKANDLKLLIATIRNDLLQLEALVGQLQNRYTRKAILKIKERYTTLTRNISIKILELPEIYKQEIAAEVSILFDQIGVHSGLFHSQLRLSEIINKTTQIILKHKALQQTLDKNILELISEAKIQTDKQMKKLSNKMNQNLFTFYVLICGAVFVSILLITVYIYPRVIKRISNLSQQTNQIALGNYDTSIDTHGTDEISQMSQALESFKQSLIAKQQAEKRLVESEQRYDVAVRGSSVGLWDWNVKTNELYWSPRFRELLGISENEFVPHHSEFENRLHPNDHQDVMTALEQHLKQKKPYDIEYKILHNNGHYLWFHARGQAIWNNADEPTRMAGSVDDISDKKQAEEELIRSNIELERFAFIASHDLQEPLRMITNFTALLKEEYSSKFDKTAGQYMEFVQSAAYRMQALIADLLEYSRAGEDITQLEDINVNDLMHVIKDSFKDAVEQNHAIIEFDQLPVINTNAVRLSRILQNLVGNALKYKRNGVPTEVKISAEKSDSSWVFSVSDNGIGIKQDYIDQIFVLFKRLHNKNEYTGTGIGLSICKKLVESIGGKIWVESEVGKGSTFYFSIPLIVEKRRVA